MKLNMYDGFFNIHSLIQIGISFEFPGIDFHAQVSDMRLMKMYQMVYCYYFWVKTGENVYRRN